MPGNSSRRGAIKKTGKGNPTAGSGGRVRRGLEGKGPTPKAKDRQYHQAHKAAKRAEKSAAKRPTKRRTSGDAEWIAGRNSVVEALRAEVPVATMYIATRIDTDDRVREALKLATERSLAILETPRGELDRLTDGGVHQGIALQVKAYRYAHPDDLLTGTTPLIVAADGITDPRNLGAIVRSAAAFGANGVLVP